MASILRLFKETSPWGWILLLLFGAGLAALVALLVTSRGRPRARTWLAGAAPLAIILTAALGYAMSARRLAKALDGEGIDRHSLIRIEAEGGSERISILVIAAALIAILLALGALVVAIGALRHPWRAKWGLAAGGAVAGFALAGILEIARLKIAAKLGVIMVVMPGSPGLFAAVFASITVLLAGAAIAGEGGGTVGHASEEARDRELGGEALVAMIAGIGSVIAALVAKQLSEWSTVFGALSGESVDGSQRIRILGEGDSDLYAFMVGGIVFCLAPLIAFGIALGPKARILARGIKGGAIGIGVCGAAVIALLLAPPLASANVASHIEARTRVPYPSGVEPIAIDVARELLSDFGTPTFIPKGKSCEQAVPSPAPGSSAPYLSNYLERRGGTFALDKNVPVSLLHCIGMRALKDDDAERFVEWVVRARFYSSGHRRGQWGERYETTEASFPLRPTTKTYVDGANARIHVTATSVQGTIPERLTSYPGNEKRVVQVSADPDVTAQRLFEAIAKTNAIAFFILVPPTTTPEIAERPPPLAPKKLEGPPPATIATTRGRTTSPASVPRKK